ncbi:MAG TPA: hypothetical protein VKY74_17050 [Chloroflexia bacterium]|nr:hypothetical protein [Chloroflexia bacterium]
MDTDATTLEQALSVLREQYGTQVKGPMRRTQGEMRKVLEMKMGIDDLSADRLVKKLCETGRLTYSSVPGAPNEPSTPDEPGTSATMPPDAGPITVPAAPAISLSGLNNPIGGAGPVPGAGMGLAGPADALAAEERGEDQTDGYWRIG